MDETLDETGGLPRDSGSRGFGKRESTACCAPSGTFAPVRSIFRHLPGDGMRRDRVRAQRLRCRRTARSLILRRLIEFSTCCATPRFRTSWAAICGWVRSPACWKRDPWRAKSTRKARSRSAIAIATAIRVRKDSSQLWNAVRRNSRPQLRRDDRTSGTPWFWDASFTRVQVKPFQPHPLFAVS